MISAHHIPTLLRLAILGLLSGGTGWAQVSPLPGRVEELPPFEVRELADDDNFDATGMGAVEEELRSAPFANDLTAVDYTLEEGLGAELAGELVALGTTSPAAAAAGEERLNLRGFPTPTQRNGFTQMGIPETLNINRTVVIQGPLVPVLGRAAPGGIQDFVTTRPSAKDRSRLEASATTQDRQRVTWESTGTLRPKRLWQRNAAEWTRRNGPEEFVREDDLKLGGALTLRHSRAASSLFSVDYRRLDAGVTPGIPEYKTTAGQKVIGPYQPLAYFNANGPQAGVLRQSLVVGAQFEAQLSRTVALRAAAEGWGRAIDQDRFTTSQLALDTGLFEGTREPRHLEQRQQALATHLELTGRFRTAEIEHKLMGYAGVTWGEYDREERALSAAERAKLPLSVRKFDPANPDYYLPAYDEALYSRVLTDRLETARYTSLEVSDRMAFARGRTVLTAGLRYDQVDLSVADRRANAAWAQTRDGTGQLSYHLGLNHQLVRNRALLFGSISTAFDPSTPVDARTGRIQDNETTLGYEGGIKGRLAGGRFDYTASAFLLYNQNIARRNPLYDDPVLDPLQLQPQLVAAGEERFAGLRAEVRYQLTPTQLVALRGVHLDAITTKSPSLDSEVGQPLTRLPADTATVLWRASPAKGGRGLSAGAALTYVGAYVANYEDDKHAYLEYPGYGLISLQGGYTWMLGTRQFFLGLSLRNALDRDLVASNARIGAERELGCTARVTF